MVFTSSWEMMDISGSLCLGVNTTMSAWGSSNPSVMRLLSDACRASIQPFQKRRETTRIYHSSCTAHEFKDHKPTPGI